MSHRSIVSGAGIRRRFALLLFTSLAVCAAARLAGQAYTFTQYTGMALNSNGSGYAGMSADRMVFDAAGNAYYGDLNNPMVRKIAADGQMSVFAGSVEGNVDAVGLAARFKRPTVVGFDAAGNLLVYDYGAGTLRQVAPNGLVTTRVQVTTPGDYSAAYVTMDANGNVYVADYYMAWVKKVATDGSVVTLAPGQGGAFYIAGIAVDRSGDVFVAASDHTIRHLAANGVWEVYAGTHNTTGANDGARLSALFNGPRSLAIDQSGNLYVSETGNHTIRVISASGTVSTLAGTAGLAGDADGVGAAARFGYPTALTFGPSGLLYLFDESTGALRSVSTAGAVATLFRNLNSADGPRAIASFGFPLHLTADAAGNLFVAEDQGTIRKIRPDGYVTTLTNFPSFQRLPPGDSATLQTPQGMVSDGAGGIFAADYFLHTIVHVDAGGAITLVAGSANRAGTANGVGSAAQFNHPVGVARDAAGNLYVSDNGNFAVRKITPDGTVSLLAGLMGVSGSADGDGTAARFSSLGGIVVGPTGDIFVADNYAIRKIAPTGSVSTLAGKLGSGGNVDGTGQAARFSRATYSIGMGDIAIDQSGNIFVADGGNLTIRKVTPLGVVTTIGGRPASGGTVDGTGSGATFYNPAGIAVDPAGNVYVTQNVSNDYTIRRGVPVFTPPVFQTAPGNLATMPGSSLVLRVNVSDAEALQWYRNGAVISGATTATYSVASATAANTGTFTVVAKNANGSVTSSPAVIATVSSTKPGRLINLSVLAPTSEAQLLTVGFVTGGSGTSGAESLLIRGIGPVLSAFHIADYLPDPVLKVVRQSDSAIVTTNDNWSGDASVAAANAQFTGLPLADANSTDAAVVAALPAGGYSVQLPGKGTQAGRVLAEIYDATSTYTPATPRLINLSCRAPVALNGGITIGFTIGGDTARTLLVRVSGPAIAAFGVADSMPDPQLKLWQGQTVLSQNAGWAADRLVKSAADAVNAFPVVDGTSHDAAVVATLAPGLYTVEASSVSGSPGSLLIEAYEVP